MGILFLVRHAQASFLEQNYDKLSALGEAQASHLGEYWARRQIVFNRVCEFHRQHGEIWRPAPLLKRLADQGKTFAEFGKNEGAAA